MADTVTRRIAMGTAAYFALAGVSRHVNDALAADSDDGGGVAPGILERNRQMFEELERQAALAKPVHKAVTFEGQQYVLHVVGTCKVANGIEWSFGRGWITDAAANPAHGHALFLQLQANGYGLAKSNGFPEVSVVYYHKLSPGEVPARTFATLYSIDLKETVIAAADPCDGRR